MAKLETQSAYDLIGLMSDYTLKLVHRDITEYRKEFPNGSKYDSTFIAMIETEMQNRLEDYYDLPTKDEDEIIEIITSDGWEVLEVYDIKKQN
jgi:hypothetical protein